MRFGFHRVDEVGKLDRVLDEEHRHVIAHQVEVAFIGEELDGKAAHIAHGVPRPARPLHRGKAHEHRGNLLRVLKKSGLGQCCMGFVSLEVTMGAAATGMHDALGNTLMVKVRDLLTHDEVFQQRRTTFSSAQAVLVVGDLDALVGTQGLAGGISSKGFQALQLGVGVGPVRGLGAGQLTFLGRILLAGHWNALLESVSVRPHDGSFQ
ncbi:hypothetical protein D3C78_947670 [compost metagenome]